MKKLALIIFALFAIVFFLSFTFSSLYWTTYHFAKIAIYGSIGFAAGYLYRSWEK